VPQLGVQFPVSHLLVEVLQTGLELGQVPQAFTPPQPLLAGPHSRLLQVGVQLPPSQCPEVVLHVGLAVGQVPQAVAPAQPLGDGPHSRLPQSGEQSPSQILSLGQALLLVQLWLPPLLQQGCPPPPHWLPQ
jgi:hypothetical protein